MLEYLITRELISSEAHILHRFLRGKIILASLLLRARDSSVGIVDIMCTKEPKNLDFLMKELMVEDEFPNFFIFSKKSNQDF
jgi:hypothetical protein